MVRKIIFLDLIVLLILLSLSPLFFYKLSQSSLNNWDEAWYASISRHVLVTGDLFNLKWNVADTFVDQPPGAFWITAVFFKIFGINDFTARAPFAIAGELCLLVTYFLGKELFNRIVGFASAIALTSAFWFLYRARSGNLDTLLTLFFILTILLALKSIKNKIFFIPFSLSLGFLVVIKSILPFLILPALFLIFYKSKIYRLKDFLLPVLCVFLTFGVWIFVQFLNDPKLALHHFIYSTRRSSLDNDFLRSFNLIKTYIHTGIGKWFWPGIVGLLTGIFLKKREFLILLTFILSYVIPFIFSPEVQIWHFIPLYPFLIISFFGSFYLILEKIIPKFLYKKSLTFFLILTFCLFLSYSQLKAAIYQFIEIPSYISDEAILSKNASFYPEKLYIDGDFVPVAHFYSNKQVTKLKANELKPLIQSNKKYLIITNTWRLDGEKISTDSLKILKKDRDKILIRKN